MTNLTTKSKEVREKRVEEMSKLKIEFPDAPVDQQIKWAKDWIYIFKTFEKSTGSSSGDSIPQMKKLIKRLQAKL